MGLDWNPLARPKPGREAEFDRLFSLLNDEERPYLTVFSAFFGITSPERKREKRLAPDLPEDAPASKAHVLFSAIRWCRFWAARGHGLDPWS